MWRRQLRSPHIQYVSDRADSNDVHLRVQNRAHIRIRSDCRMGPPFASGDRHGEIAGARVQIGRKLFADSGKCPVPLGKVIAGIELAGVIVKSTPRSALEIETGIIPSQDLRGLQLSRVSLGFNFFLLANGRLSRMGWSALKPNV